MKAAQMSVNPETGEEMLNNYRMRVRRHWINHNKEYTWFQCKTLASVGENTVQHDATGRAFN